MAKLVISYAVVFVVLLLGLGFSFWRLKRSRVKLPSMAALKISYREELRNEWHDLAHPDFWLKVLRATFIALSAGVSVAIFMIPYGSGWMVIGLLVSLLLLAVLLLYLLA